MYDLGEKYPKSMGVESPSTMKQEIHYPYLNISQDIGLEESDVGKTVYAKVKLYVKEVSKRVDSRAGEKTKKTERAEFDVKGIEFIKKPTRDEVGESVAEDFLKK